MDCYITNGRDGAKLPTYLNKENTLYYPEQRMTTHDCLHSGRPSGLHIVTDNLFLVGLYDKNEVFIWRNGEWTNPKCQTFAASFSYNLSEVFDYDNTIPKAIVDGKITNIMGFNRK